VRGESSVETPETESDSTLDHCEEEGNDVMDTGRGAHTSTVSTNGSGTRDTDDGGSDQETGDDQEIENMDVDNEDWKDTYADKISSNDTDTANKRTENITQPSTPLGPPSNPETITTTTTTTSKSPGVTTGEQSRVHITVTTTITTIKTVTTTTTTVPATEGTEAPPITSVTTTTTTTKTTKTPLGQSQE
jgi:hypothetical protein